MDDKEKDTQQKEFMKLVYDNLERIIEERPRNPVTEFAYR
jgi:hypothetical protein